MKVLIPSPLLSYTLVRDVEAVGTTLDEVMTDLDRQFPGIRFRMIDEQGRVRAHMRVFINGQQVFDLGHATRDSDDIAIVQALSGG